MTLPGTADTPARTPRRRWRTALLAGATLAAGIAAGLAAAPAASANTPMTHDPRGSIEKFTLTTGSVEATGWAYDPDVRTSNATLYGLVDGRWAATATTTVARPIFARHQHLGATPGFDFTIPVPAGGVHVVCVAARNVAGGLNRVLGCHMTPQGARLSASQAAARSPHGVISALHTTASSVRLTGWVQEPDYGSNRVLMVLYVDGKSVRTFATRTATASQRAAGAGAHGAFDVSASVGRGAHLACLWAVDQGLGGNTLLGCQASDTRGRAGTGPVKTPTINTKALNEARKHLGQPYVWGAVGPKRFDCSGLVMYSYHKAGYSTPRIAEDQFAAARLIPASRAVRGDLVFYHDATGYVFHVGIYTGPGQTIAAVDPQEGVTRQSIDAWSATYGSYTHI